MVSKQKSLAKVNLSSEYGDNHDQNDDYGMVMNDDDDDIAGGGAGKK